MRGGGQIVAERTRAGAAEGAAAYPGTGAGMDWMEGSTPPPRPRHGAVWVQQGQIRVSDPEAGGMFAVLRIPEDERLTVWVDGVRARGEIVVDTRTPLLVRMKTEPARVSYSWKVAPDGLSATLCKQVTRGRTVRLVDTPPMRVLALRMEEVSLAPPPTPMEEMLARVRDAGWVGEVDAAALGELAQAEETTERVVVRGQAARRPEPERYRRLIPEPTGRARLDVTTVSAGTPVAEVIPPLPGVPGRDVHGREIPIPPAVRGPVLGDGVTVVQDRVVALRSGRLVFGPNRIDVHRELVIERDVTAEDGPVVFDGAITVRGSVLDGATVRAQGDVTVEGGVLRALVLAGGSVDVAGHIVGSRVFAGHEASAYDAILPLVRDIASTLLNFQRDCSILVENAAKRPDAPRIIPRIPDLLLQGRYTLLAASLQVFADDVHQLSEWDEHYRRLARMWTQRWTGLARTRLAPEDVLALVQGFQDYLEQVERAAQAPEAHLTASSVASSTVHATGDVVIHGAGVFTSGVESGGSVEIQGCVRGGFIHAERAAHIGELGSEFGVECSVRVRRADGRIRVGTRHPQTTLVCGQRRDRNLVTQHRVDFVSRPAEGGCP
ncbi:MAG: FapA family protein [Alicyclobacillus sp.]|nr:FapA family protein [Alicyclobacillus sp.]